MSFVFNAKYEQRKRSESPNRRDESSSSSSSSSDSESDCEDNIGELYCYLKHKLMKDDKMMIAGSDAYWNAYSTAQRVLIQNEASPFDLTTVSENVDYPYTGAPGFVREDGVYVIFFIAETNESAQFTIFINGVPSLLTTVGNNAGAGQLISRWILPLKKNDNLTARNYQSVIGALNIPAKVGGLNDNVNFGITLLKIAPYEEYCWDEKDCDFSHKQKHLFRQLEKKLLCDPELQLEGFNVHGSFYSKVAQTVAVEAPVVFSSSINVHHLCPVVQSPSNSFSQVKIEKDGVYKIFFLANSDTAAQFAVFVNGVPDVSTINGTNRGAGQITIRSLLKLKKGDMLSIVNHTSGAPVIIPENAGGQIQGLSCVFIIFKISPLYVCEKPVYHHRYEKHNDGLYRDFKRYLLSNKYTEPAGSDSFLSVSSMTTQTVQIGESITWNVKIADRNIHFDQGKQDIIIKRTGDYDMFVDIISSRPSQFTIFVNNKPMMETTSGRDSGSNRCLLRQILYLCKGDCVSVRNYQSLLGSVTTSDALGGMFVGTSASLMMFKLSNPICERKEKY
jgi:hypothetical protein